MEVSRRVPIRYATLLEKRKLPWFPPDHAPSGKARYDVIAIKAAIHVHKSAHNFGGKNSNRLNEREKAYADRARIAAEREKFKLDIEKAEYIPRIKANNDIEAANTIVRRELYEAFVIELPPRTEMMQATEIRKINEAKYRQVISHLPGLIMGANGSSGHRQ